MLQRFLGLWWLAMGILCAIPTTTVSAAEWANYNLPRSSVNIDGFTCVVGVLNSGAEGYLPVSFTARATVGTFPGDRQLWLRIVPETRGNIPAPETTYSCSILLPAGSPSASVDFHLPKYFVGGNFSLQVLDAEGPLKGYSFDLQTRGTPFTHSGYTLSELATRLAVILPDATDVQNQAWQRVPDLRTLDTSVFPDARFLNDSDPGRLSDDEALDHIRLRSVRTDQLMRMSDAHTGWLGYESVDVAIIAFPLLEKMREVEPLRYDALRDWVSCGGVVWTYGIGDKRSLSRFFGVPASPEPVQPPDEFDRAENALDTNAALPIDEWVLGQLRPEPLTTEEINLLRMNRAALWDRLESDGHPYAGKETASALRGELVRLPLESGVVVGMVSADPFPGSYGYWHTVQHLSGRNQVWGYRRATSLVRGSESYWEWLLANVARPPVYAFLTVLTAFVLLVGPVSYYWTRRIGRSFLMFLIAPVLATVATLALFGYGLIADGLGTQARIRQITWSDGATGRAARSTRGTYFAAFRQADGLAFPEDAAVYPILDPAVAAERLHSPTMRRTRQVVLNGDTQRFLGDFLPSRSQSQFIHFRPLEDRCRIAIHMETGHAPTITNHLVETLNSLIARTSDGQYWTLGAPCPPEEKATLRPLASADKSLALRTLYQTESPGVPPGFVHSSVRSWSRYGYIGSTRLRTDNRSWSQSNDAVGIFEAELREQLADAAELPLGGYAGLADLSGEARAVDGAEVLNSVHIVMGTFE